MRDFTRKALELTQGKSRAALENEEVLRLALTRLVELMARLPAMCHLRRKRNILRFLGRRW